MLEVKALTTHAFAAVDLGVEPGATIAITGASGAGKSTLLTAIADLCPNDGAVVLDGVNRDSVPAPLWRRRVTYQAAEPGWWEEMTAAHFEDPAAAAELATRLLLKAGILDEPVRRLSTGERQRLALVRTLSIQPQVLLLDEPTAALDEDSVHAAETLLHEYLETPGRCLVLVSHDKSQAARMGARVLELKDGGLASPGRPA